MEITPSLDLAPSQELRIMRRPSPPPDCNSAIQPQETHAVRYGLIFDVSCKILKVCSSTSGSLCMICHGIPPNFPVDDYYSGK